MYNIYIFIYIGIYNNNILYIHIILCRHHVSDGQTEWSQCHSEFELSQDVQADYTRHIFLNHTEQP
jgi:hypothetical protein